MRELWKLIESLVAMEGTITAHSIRRTCCFTTGSCLEATSIAIERVRIYPHYIVLCLLNKIVT